MKVSVYLARSETPFRTAIAGTTPDRVLSSRFPFAAYAPPPSKGDCAFLYDDTLLVTPQTLERAAERLGALGGGVAQIGKGWIRIGNGDLRYRISDDWAIRIENIETFRETERRLYAEKSEELERMGALLFAPELCRVGWETRCEAGAEIYPFSVLNGRCSIARGAKICSYCTLTDVEVGAEAVLEGVHAVGAKIGEGCTVGPFACLRKGAVLGAGCRVGDFVEIKNSVLGEGVKAAHLAYVGDSSVGAGSNVGCGAVFANYDGKRKQSVRVGEGVFIGCNVNLVAPVEIGDGAYIAAGSTITENVPSATLCIARSKQIFKPDRGWKKEKPSLSEGKR